MSTRIALLLTLVVGILLLAPSAGAISARACRPDHSPGVVTHWEYNHTRAGETRQQIACLYGARGHVTIGFWGPDRRFHLAVDYPALNGHSVEIVFVDRRSTGNDWHVRSKFWYNPTA